MASDTQPAATSASEPRKSVFEAIVTGTPVLLTVVATFMIGRSSGEMTQAQYYRAVASQNQSKVGDQWGFYQAKRIRGEILASNAELLYAQPRDLFTNETLIDAAEELLREIGGAEKDASAAEATKKKHEGLLAQATKLRDDARAMLQAPTERVQAALNAIGPIPEKKDMPARAIKTDEQALLLDEIIADIKARKHEDEKDMAAKVLKLRDDTLKKAIKDAADKANDTYQRGKNIEDVLDELDALVDRQSTLALQFRQLAAKLPGSWPKRSEVMRSNITRLHGDYKSARNAYGARRNEADARSNQYSAYLYDVKVLVSSARSDKHLARSYLFLAAMLIAQVGVTIATLAMAVRFKSPIWAVATIAGAIAIGFGVYVLLDLPVPAF
ncbi:MAG: DUF4337 family protein [Planctomycetes bacterium]|nr:DUF4337 family protein [Planctomycetota bacterium]